MKARAKEKNQIWYAIGSTYVRLLREKPTNEAKNKTKNTKALYSSTAYV